MVQEQEPAQRGRVFVTTPQFPSAPDVPEPPLTERRYQVGELEIRPLAGPEIPIPPEEDEQFLERFSGWHDQTNGSIPEFVVWEFLIFKKKQQPGSDFVYQHPVLGGRTEFGGFVLDFFFPLRRVGWRVQGERWHLLQPQDRARDAIAKVLLTARGIEVIDLWEDDLLSRTAFTLESAWQGRELPNPALD